MLIPTKLSLPSLQTSPLKTDKWTELPSFFPRQIASNPNYAAFLPKCSIQTYPVVTVPKLEMCFRVSTVDSAHT